MPADIFHVSSIKSNKTRGVVSRDVVCVCVRERERGGMKVAVRGLACVHAGSQNTFGVGGWIAEGSYGEVKGREGEGEVR